MRVLALEPYFAGSHRRFLEDWSAGSGHAFTLLTLPARKWKWRMRQAAVGFAHELEDRDRRGEAWDVLWAADMLNLAELIGLVPERVRRLPRVAYFHENQLTYPVRHADERDWHYGLINMTTALAADEVWFNSGFHRDTFLEALDELLRRMPDQRPMHVPERIRARSHVVPQGISSFPARGPRRPGPLRIVWAARWEHDKNPDAFFAALEALVARGVEFRVSVLGERFRSVPEVFSRAERTLADHLDHFGWIEDQDAYRAVLLDSDVVVSCARHEFFGVSVAEAMAAGAWPLVPEDLAYPELLRRLPDPRPHFCAPEADTLAAALATLAKRVAAGALWADDPQAGRRAVEPFTWARLRPRLDSRLEQVAALQEGSGAR